jgi:plasma-membrane proton-efflux P-type ATPase
MATQPGLVTPSAKAPAVTAAPDPDSLSTPRTNPETGLSKTEVDARREVSGWNEVSVKPGHPVLDFLRKFWGVAAWMLELILVVSVVLGQYSDVAVVGGLLVFNALIGYAQDRRATGVVESLKRRLQVDARVLRDSAWQVVPARELVPGDVVRLRPGDILPADVELLDGQLAVDQSALTGESKDADKTKGEVVSSGSVVRRGEGKGVVLLIGDKTLFGRTTRLVQEAEPKLHIEAEIATVVRWLFLIVIAMLCPVAVLSAIHHAPLGEMVPLLLVLLMSAVPVALPVMFTVSLAVGSKELAKRGVLVTRMSATEDAATMDVLCVDKTGTITMNRLAVTGVLPSDKATETDVIRAGALASRESNQDPIDLAFLVAASQRRIFADEPKPTRLSFDPFDAVNRRTEAVFEQDGTKFRVMKGAVRTIAQACGYEPGAIEALEARESESARKGYRTLAVARGPQTGQMALLGLVFLEDPIRPDAKQLISTLGARGIRVKMLTGDGFAVATEIGRQVGLSDIRHIADLKDEIGKSRGSQSDTFEGVDGFAEVFPEDKYLVVKHLQDTGHVTGMTGDGVNDAPALRQAEVGIAVFSATDVAKGAASVVLTDPGLANIVSLVEQGRILYQRILTYIVNKISRTILKGAFVAIAFLATGKFVVSAFTMLILVFMTDFPNIALATDRVRSSPKPETWKIGGYVLVSLVLGVAMVAEALFLLWFCWARFALASRSDALYTFSFLLLLYFAVFSVVSARERGWFWSTWPSRALRWALLADVVVGTLLTYMGMPGLVHLPLIQSVSILLCALVACLGVNDAIKVLMIRNFAMPTASSILPPTPIEAGRAQTATTP